MKSWPVTAFNLTYLCVLWGLVIAASARMRRLSVERRRTARWVLAAFFLLALGDSFHLISQAYEFITGVNPLAPFLGLTWVGFGRLVSSFTLTIFYLCLLMYCQRKWGLPWSGWLWLSLVSGAVRLILLPFPQNHWDGERTLWSLWRNIPFVIQGMGVMVLLFQQASRQSLPLRRLVQTLAYAILVSFVTYSGTIVGVFWHPAFGALMLPKTIAYMVAVWLLYSMEFRPSQDIH
ncbi:MAG TPA: hypothetical protein PLH19_02795 [Anaerolineae bacterium]|nr:hypothetical protein [Anaerolineae bacterium]HQH37447.1 hypothetical protein [Anaerolineae bacterium]